MVLIRLFLLAALVIFSSPMVVFSQANYDTEAFDALNHAKEQYGTAEDEAALYGALQNHLDANGNPLVTQQEKDANPFYNSITSFADGVRTCTASRNLRVESEQRILEMKGKFLLRGNHFYSDLRTCKVTRTYEPYTEEVDLPPKIITRSTSFGYKDCSKVRRADGMRADCERWRDSAILRAYGVRCTSFVDCLKKISNSLMSPCLAPGMVTFNYSVSKVFSFQTTKLTAVCTTPQTGTITKLKEILTNNCQTLDSQCTYLRTEDGPGGCKTISGVEVCPPWWFQTVTYSCMKQYECNLFPTSNDKCGSWFAKDLSSCLDSSQTGMKSIALKKFRQIQESFTCETFTSRPLSLTIPSSSPYYQGCGLYDPLKTNKYQLIKKEQGAIEATCISSLGNLPLNLLNQREDISPVSGGQFKYATLDYWTEHETDSCPAFLAEMQKQNIPCTLIEEKTDGVVTLSQGVVSQIPASCKILQGKITGYEFCRPFWEKKTTYQCVIPPMNVNTTPSTEITLPVPPLPPEEAGNTDGMGEALGTLAAATAIAEGISSDLICTAPLPDGSCPSDKLLLFSGTDKSCKKSSLELRLANSTCCKADVIGCADKTVGVLCDEFCEQRDIDLSLFHYTNHRTQIIGEYCASWLLGISGGTCLTKRQGHCVFGSILAKIFQVQGRAQLGRTFGDPDAPDCSGLTIADFKAIDFSRLDFTEFANSLDLSPQQVDDIDPARLTQTIQTQINGVSGGP